MIVSKVRARGAFSICLVNIFHSQRIYDFFGGFVTTVNKIINSLVELDDPRIRRFVVSV